MNEYNLVVDSLSKSYSTKNKRGLFRRSDNSNLKRIQALNCVSFKLKNGFYGLLGPNGAGKSTLMNILSLNLDPDSGSVFFCGNDIRKKQKEFRTVLGYMPQQQTIYNDFSGTEFLYYMCTLKGITEKSENVMRVAEIVNLIDCLDKKIGAYSGGMKQRILAASALLGDPKLVILDEPTAGLDPKERVILRNKIAELAREKIIIMSTHVVSDVENVVDEILIMNKGNLIAQSSVEDLKNKYSNVESLEGAYMMLFSE